MTSVLDFYDAQAASYDEVVSTPLGCEVRRAFWGLVDRFVSPDACVLDFGCGTGVDAEQYALSGRTVVAYDLSTSMLSRLRERCAAHIEAGRIVVVEGPIQRLYKAIEEAPPVSALTANFAVLNLLPDLSTISDLAQARLPSLEAVVVSVQNPFYIQDMRRAWWWAAARRLPRTGWIEYRDSPAPTRRYRTSRLLEAFEPTFRVRARLSPVRGRIRDRAPLNRLGHLLLMALTRRT